MKSNEELINTIENIVAEIQSFDEGKNSYNNHSSEWKNRFDKLTNIVLDYVAINNKSYFDKVDNTTDNEKKSITAFKYNIELFRALKNAVENYNNSRGSFINYFSFIFKREIDKIKQKEYVDDMRAGIHLPDNKLRRIRTLKKLAEKNVKDLDDPKTIDWLAVQMKCSTNEVNNLIMITTQKGVDNVAENDDGDTADLLENMCTPQEQSVEEKTIETITDKEVLDKINKIENHFSDSHKAIITHCFSQRFQRDVLAKYSFFSDSEYEKCYNQQRTQKDVTDDYGLDKSSYNQYLRRLAVKIKK